MEACLAGRQETIVPSYPLCTVATICLPLGQKVIVKASQPLTILFSPKMCFGFAILFSGLFKTPSVGKVDFVLLILLSPFPTYCACRYVVPCIVKMAFFNHQRFQCNMGKLTWTNESILNFLVGRGLITRQPSSCSNTFNKLDCLVFPSAFPKQGSFHNSRISYRTIDLQ